MRPVFGIRRIMSFIAVTGLVASGVYLGAAPADARPPSTTTQFTISQPDAIDPGSQASITVDVKQCDASQVCLGPISFYGLPDSPTTVDDVDLEVHKSTDASGVWNPVELVAAPDTSGSATATFQTEALYASATYTFRMGGDASVWYGSLTPGSFVAVQGAVSAPVTVTVNPPHLPNNASLDFTVGSVTTQSVSVSDLSGTYPNGTELNITNLPEGFTQVWNGSTLDISTTAAADASGTFATQLIDNSDINNPVVLTTAQIPFTLTNPNNGGGGGTTDPCLDNPSLPECNTGGTTAPAIATNGFALDPMTVGTEATQSVDMAQFLNADAAAFYIVGVMGLPDGVTANISGTTLTLLGTPTTAGSGTATVLFSDGDGGALSGDNTLTWTVSDAQTQGAFTSGCFDYHFGGNFGFPTGPLTLDSGECVSPTDGWDWTNGGKLYSNDLPAGLTLKLDNPDLGRNDGYSIAGQRPTATVSGITQNWGPISFHVIIETPTLIASVPINYVVENYDRITLWPGLNVSDPDNYTIHFSQLATDDLHMVLFENGAIVRVLALTGRTGDVTSADLNLSAYIDPYVEHSLVVRTYKTWQFHEENLPTLESPYDATETFTLAAKPASLTRSTGFTVASTDPAGTLTYAGPSGKMLAAYGQNYDGTYTLIDHQAINNGDQVSYAWADFGKTNYSRTVWWRVLDLAPDAAVPAYDDESAVLTYVAVQFEQEPIPSADLSLNTMSYGDSTTLTYHGPDHSEVCAYTTVSLTPIICSWADDGGTQTASYLELMGSYYMFEPWSAYTTEFINIKMWTPTDLKELGISTTQLQQLDASVPSRASTNLVLNAAPMASISQALQLPAFKVGQSIEFSIDLTDYTSNFDWTYGSKPIVDPATVPDGLSVDFDTPKGAAPVMYVWGTPTTAGSGAMSLQLNDYTFGHASADLPWTVAENTPSLTTDLNTISEGDTAHLTYAGPDPSTVNYAIWNSHTGIMSSGALTDLSLFDPQTSIISLDYATAKADDSNSGSVTVRLYTGPVPSAATSMAADTDYVSSVTMRVPAVSGGVLAAATAGRDYSEVMPIDPSAVGFDWTNGGRFEVTGLPEGISYSVFNGDPDRNNLFSLPGSAPELWIYGDTTALAANEGALLHITVFDATGAHASMNVGLRVNPAPALSPFDFGAMTVGAAYSQSFEMLYYANGFDWTHGGFASISGLPDGITCTVSNQDSDSPVGWSPFGSWPILLCEGTPTTEGSGLAALHVKDQYGNDQTVDVPWTVGPSTAPVVLPITVPSAWAGMYYDETIDLSTYAVNFTFDNGSTATLSGLPTGLSWEIANPDPTDVTFAVAGQAPKIRIFGTPESAGDSTLTVSVQDNYEHSATTTTTLPVTQVQASLSPGTLLPGDSTTFAYTGPSGAVLCFWVGTNPDKPFVCGPIYGVANAQLTYDELLAFNNNEPLADPMTVSFVVYDRNAVPEDLSQISTTTPFVTAADVTLLPTPKYEITPPTQTVGPGQSAAFTYNGPSDAVTAFWYNGQLVWWGPAGDVLQPTSWSVLAQTVRNTPDGPNTFTVSVYSRTFDFANLVAPTLDEPAADSVTVTVDMPTPTLTAPDLGALKDGTPYDQTFDLSTLANNFDWIYGGSVDITGLPAGLSFELTNPVSEGSGTSVFGQAPSIRIFGTPTATGPFEATITVHDNAFGEGGGQTASATVTGTVQQVISLTPSHIDAVLSSNLFDITYNGPSDRVMALWHGDQLCVWDGASTLLSNLRPTTLTTCTGTVASTQQFTLKVYDRSTEGATAPTDTEVAVASTTITLASNLATVVPMSLGDLKVGQPYDKSFDMSDYATGFVWAWSTASMDNLPAGLQYEIVNADSGIWVTSGAAPVLRVFGTPTIAGPNNGVVTVKDGIFGMAGGQTASAPLVGTVVATEVPSDPPAKIITGPGTVGFDIPGMTTGASLEPMEFALGVSDVTFTDGTVTVHVRLGFSGRIDQLVQVTQEGITTTVHLRLTVRPLATTHNVFTLKSGKTTIHWTASPNATSYKVVVNGHVVCSTRATTCTFAGLYGPKAVVKVVAYGGDNLTATASAGYVRSTVAAPFGSVLFGADSAALTTSAKKVLHNYVLAITRQGFTQVTVNGYAAHWPASISAKDKAFRIALTKKRAETVRAYLANEFKKLGVKVSVKTLGDGGSHPTVSGTSSTTDAGNRRADISVS